MAILYFEAKVNYEKLVELQRKIDELKRQLTSFDFTITPKADLSGLLKQLASARKEMHELQSNATMAGQMLQTAFKSIDRLPKGMRQADSAAKGLTRTLNEANESANGISQGVSSFTKQFTLAALTLKGIEATIGVIKDGVNKIVDFEQANARLAAILGLSVEQLREMTDSAEKLGRTTVYTASQVTQLQTSLSKLGFKREDILGMQEAILYFAQATGSALDDAASTTGAALRMFGVQAEDYQKQVGRFTGAMSAATMRSALDFRTIADNLATFGPMAHAMNLEIEDTLALFGTLRNMGIEGSTAMTSLRNIFTKVAQGKIAGMGDVKSLEDFVEGLKQLNDLDPGKGMKMIGPRGGTQFITLIQQADNILKLRDEIRAGANAETTAGMGATMINTMSGSIKMLQSAWEGFVLSFQKSSVPLKSVLDMVTTGIQKATGFITSGKGDLPLEQINNMINAIQAVVVSLVAYKGMQALIRAGYKQETAELQALVVAKNAELDADLKVMVGRKMLTSEQAQTIQALRAQAMVQYEAVRATLAKTEADIASLTAIREKDIATLQETEAEIANAKAKMANSNVTNRQTYTKKLHSLELKKEALEQALNNSAVELGTLETQKNTMAEMSNTMAKSLNANGTRAATTAQLLWNSAVSKGKKVLDVLTMGLLTNPYALIAIAVGALAYAIYDLVTAEDAATIAQKNLNDAMKAHAEQMENNKNKAAQLKGVMNDQTATTYQQLKAYRELIATYRNFAGLSKEQIASMSEQEFQSRINAENDQKQKEYLENRIKALRELQNVADTFANKQFTMFSNWSDSLFGTNIGFDSKFAEIKKQYDIDLSNIFDGANIVSPDLSRIVQEALKAAYKEIAQFNSDLQESYNEAAVRAADFTSKEADIIAGYYAKAQSLQEQLALGTPIIPLDTQMDDTINALNVKLSELKQQLQNEPMNLSLAIKIENYEKVLADMLTYKGLLQTDLDKDPLNFKVGFRFPSKLPSFNFPPGYFVTAPTQDDTPQTTEDENHDKNAEKKARQQQEKYRSTMARIAKEREKQAQEAAIAEAEARISAMQDGSEKTLAQIELNYEKEKNKIEDEYKKIKETYIQQEKDLWLANPKNAEMNEGDWLKSSRYAEVSNGFEYSESQRTARREKETAASAKYISELMKLSESYSSTQEKALNERVKLNEQIKAVEHIIIKSQNDEIKLTEKQIDQLQQRLKLMEQQSKIPIKDEYAAKFIQEFGSYEQQLDAIVKEYEEKITMANAENNWSKVVYYNVKKDNAASEVAERQLKDFTSSPLFTSAMSDALFSEEAMSKVKDGMDAMMKTAAKSMDTNSFSKYLETYEKVFDKLASVNPFNALKAANTELETARKNLDEMKANYEEVSASETQNQQELGKQKTEYERMVAEAKSTEERTKAQQELDKVNVSLTQSQIRLNDATMKYNNAQADVENKTQQVQKATKACIIVFAKFQDMFAAIGDTVGGYVGQVLSGTSNLIGTAMNSIDILKEASDTTQKGIAKVAAAVQKATAILEIIQVAWQLMNTIFSLFSGSEEKLYQEKVDALGGELDALDYQFGKLKETMDDAWGLEGINAYTQAVQNLTNSIATQQELIRTKLKKSKSGIGGYHSLAYKIDKKVGQSDWDSLNAVLSAAGFDYYIQSITDLLSLSPEALQAIMSSAAWVKIAGLIASQENDVYSGSDLLKDLQDVADMADSISDQWDELAAKMNGISFDSLKDEFRSLVQEADTSFNDITASWDKFMRDAIFNQIASGYEADLEDFYNRLSELNKLRNEGNISDAEYKAALARLKEEYYKSIYDARNEYEQSLTDAGVNRKDVQQSATQGGFETMSEDTGSKLDGRFASLQATASAIYDKISVAAYDKLNVAVDTLTAGFGNVVNSTEQIQGIMANSFLELQGIRENTEVIIKPIKEMAINVQELKEKLI